MTNILEKLIIILSLFYFVNNCSNSESQKITPSYSSINVDTPRDRYNSLLGYELQKLTKNTIHNEKYNLSASIKYNSQNVLNVRGLDSLNEIEGSISYKLINSKSKKLIKQGKVIKRINHGSISSLYGKNQNLNHIKERLVKSLSKSIYNQIKLYLN